MASAAKRASVIVGTRGLGKALGRSHVAMARWLKDPRWKFGKGPWQPSQISQIAAWLQAETSESGSSVRDMTPMQKVNLALKGAKAQREKFELEKQRGKFHSVDECNARCARKALLFRESLQHMVLSSAKFGDEVKSWLETACRRICDQYASGFEG